MPASDVDSRQLNKAQRNAEIVATSGNEWADASVAFVPELIHSVEFSIHYDRIANLKTAGGGPHDHHSGL